MKRTTISLLLVGLALALAPLKSGAQPTPNPPGQISYQGFLTDANGLPLATNTPVNYNVIFRIFDASTSGNLRWAEQQVVTVDRGYFTVMLGNGSAVSGAPSSHDLSSVFSDSTASDRYLELTVQGLAPGDPPIAPRLRLLASPYSFLASKAMSVDGSAVTTGTIGDARLSSNVALRSGGNSFSGDQYIFGNVGIGNATPETTLQVGSYGAPDQYLTVSTEGGNLFRSGIKLRHFDNGYGWTLVSDERDNSFQLLSHFADPNGVTRMYVDRFSGNVGIGTASPANKLDVNGGISLSGSLTMANSQIIQGRNSTGTAEDFLWPRYADNVTYLNYGSAGFNIRNNSSTTTMFMDNSGNVSVSGNMGIGGNVGISGTVGIGTSSPFAPLEINHVQNKTNPQDFLLAVEANRDVLWMRTFSAGGPYNLELWEGGAFKPGGGSWGSVSDIRLKKDVRNLEGALDSLLNLRSVTFEFKDPAAVHEKPGRHTGFIAQEVEKVFPEWVIEAPGGMKAVAPVGFESLTVQALRELRAETDAQIQDLREQNAALEKRLQRLERSLNAVAQEK